MFYLNRFIHSSDINNLNNSNLKKIFQLNKLKKEMYIDLYRYKSMHLKNINSKSVYVFKKLLIRYLNYMSWIRKYDLLRYKLSISNQASKSSVKLLSNLKSLDSKTKKINTLKQNILLSSNYSKKKRINTKKHINLDKKQKKKKIDDYQNTLHNSIRYVYRNYEKPLKFIELVVNIKDKQNLKNTSNKNKINYYRNIRNRMFFLKNIGFFKKSTFSKNKDIQVESLLEKKIKSRIYKKIDIVRKVTHNTIFSNYTHLNKVYNSSNSEIDYNIDFETYYINKFEKSTYLKLNSSFYWLFLNLSSYFNSKDVNTLLFEHLEKIKHSNTFSSKIELEKQKEQNKKRSTKYLLQMFLSYLYNSTNKLYNKKDNIIRNTLTYKNTNSVHDNYLIYNYSNNRFNINISEDTRSLNMVLLKKKYIKQELCNRKKLSLLYNVSNFFYTVLNQINQKIYDKYIFRLIDLINTKSIVNLIRKKHITTKLKKKKSLKKKIFNTIKRIKLRKSMLKLIKLKKQGNKKKKRKSKYNKGRIISKSYDDRMRAYKIWEDKIYKNKRSIKKYNVKEIKRSIMFMFGKVLKQNNTNKTNFLNNKVLVNKLSIWLFNNFLILRSWKHAKYSKKKKLIYKEKIVNQINIYNSGMINTNWNDLVIYNNYSPYFTSSKYLVNNNTSYIFDNYKYIKNNNVFYKQYTKTKLVSNYNSLLKQHNLNPIHNKYTLDSKYTNYINNYLIRHTKKYLSNIKLNILQNSSIYNNFTSNVYPYKYLYKLYYNKPYITKRTPDIYFSSKKNSFIGFKLFSKLRMKKFEEEGIREFNIRYQFKKIYLYFFFKWFNKKIFNHQLSLLFNSFNSIQKERSTLKKKIITNINTYRIGSIIYKNSLKNIFLTLRNSEGKVICTFSSGQLPSSGRRKVLDRTIKKLTKKFVVKLRKFIVNYKINNYKIILKGSLINVFNFLDVFKYRIKSSDDYNESVIASNHFFINYINYIKSKIRLYKQNVRFNFNYYINLINYLYMLWEYLVNKPKRGKFDKINILYIKKQKKYSFIK